MIAHATLNTLPDEPYLDSVVAAADEAIICNDRDGRITAWTSGAERMLGYTAAEIIGRDISLLFTPKDNGRKRRRWFKSGTAKAPPAPTASWFAKTAGGSMCR